MVVFSTALWTSWHYYYDHLRPYKISKESFWREHYIWDYCYFADTSVTMKVWFCTFLCIFFLLQREFWPTRVWALQHIGWKVSLFAYWLWSCVVTVLKLLTKFWGPLVLTLLNYFLHSRSITSACRTCLRGWSKHFTSRYDPSTPPNTTPPPTHPLSPHGFNWSVPPLCFA